MIGILGGMGTQAGLDFCDKLAKLNRGKLDQKYPMFVLYNKSNTPRRAENLKQYKNVLKDPRVTVMIWKHDNPFKFVEVRGVVVGEITGQDARDNIDRLSEKYWDKPYPFPVETERIVLIIKPNKEVMFNLKDEDFE